MIKISKEIYSEAVDWLMRMQEAELSDTDQLQFEQWKNLSSEHHYVWQKTLEMSKLIEQIPSDITQPILKNMDQYQAKDKKNLYLGSTFTFIFIFIIYFMYPYSPWYADYQTDAIKQKTIQLPDGGMLTLNNSSAIDVNYSNDLRKIVIKRGDIWIKTHHDVMNRPFIVESSHGTVQALGTEYYISQRNENTLTAVDVGAIKVTPEQSAQTLILNKSQQVIFNSQHIFNAMPIQPSSFAWKSGFIMADNITLKALMNDLQPYKKGLVYLSDDVKNIKVSGNFPTQNLQQTYQMISNTYHVNVDEFLNGYIIKIKKNKKN
ncbi:FecR family protein [Acinetobacter sp. ANC 4558]|uniref:FecR family protein n=1 Tax=Acinetobacter sp. ANC 4558 TaxID=1977876 RepID=UPI00148AD786|nr:FecR domain-containing protein [Acinetobacter sp. ANC 4558]